MSEGVEEWLPDEPGPPPMGWYNWVLARSALERQPRAAEPAPLPGMTPRPRRSLSIARHMIGTGPVCKNCNCGRK